MKKLSHLILRRVLPLLTAILLPLTAVGCGGKESGNTDDASSTDSSGVLTTDNSSTSSEKVDKRYQIADFYKEELEDTRTKLKDVQTADGFSYLFISDTHIDYTGGSKSERPVIERQLAALVELANTTDVDCIILGGDIIHGTSSYDSSVNDLKFFVDILSKSNVPVYAVHGNHDSNMYHGNPCPMEYVISPDYWSENFVDPLSRNTVVHDANNPKSTYYYVDFPEKKTRLIVLDPYNHPVTSSDGYYCDYYTESWNHVDEAQLDWFASVALTAQNDGWQYVLSVHGPIIGSETVGKPATIEKIVTAFNNGSTYTLSNGTVVDYSKYTSYIPVYQCGHTHVNSFKYSNSSKFISIVTGSGKISYYPENSDYYDNRYDGDWVYHPARVFGEISEATFDAVNISPDGTVSRIAFGAGQDNNFDISAFKK